MGAMDDLLGQTLGRDGRWEIVRKVGEGGFGVVFEARDTRDGGRYAAKFLRPERVLSGDFAERFRREGVRWKEVSHPGLVKIHGLGRKSGCYFILSEYIDGVDLGGVIESEGPLAADEALRITRSAAEALQVVHDNRIVHRDLKPENVMLTTEDRAVKILDFGMAKYLDTESLRTQPGIMLGTPGYMAPEYLKGLDFDGRADIFALGAILYEMLTGQRAFKARQVKQVIRDTIDAEPAPADRVNAAVAKPVVRLIQRMLKKNPHRRPASMNEVVSAVDAVSAALAANEGGGSGLGGFLRRVFER